MTNYYELLGIAPQATNIEIHDAYLKSLHDFRDSLARPIHADHTKVRLLEEAYRVLSDPSSRAAYDQSLGIGVQSRSSRVHFEPGGVNGKAMLGSNLAPGTYQYPISVRIALFIGVPSMLYWILRTTADRMEFVVVTVFVVPLMVFTIFDRVTFDGRSITVRTAFRNKTFDIRNVEGYKTRNNGRSGKEYYLVLRTPDKNDVMLPSSAVYDRNFKSWLTSLRCLDGRVLSR